MPAETADVRDADLRVERMRGHGRGGQRRNKVETAVRVTHVPSGITVVRMSGRSQAANLADARDEIAARLTAAASTEQQASTGRERAPMITPRPVGEGVRPLCVPGRGHTALGRAAVDDSTLAARANRLTLRRDR